ncbi:hypothetical protein RRF57_009038 [Xylaria bambusicola]|uniref:Uncharacterized protein n=1 Tax=Xylaria bambusicola TaxID=326684 RepID=A0AAN7UIV7_9PEZI
MTCSEGQEDVGDAEAIGHKLEVDMMMLGGVWPQFSARHEEYCLGDATDRGLPQDSVTWNGLDNRRLPDISPPPPQTPQNGTELYDSWHERIYRDVIAEVKVRQAARVRHVRNEEGYQEFSDEMMAH